MNGKPTHEQMSVIVSIAMASQTAVLTGMARGE